MDDVDRQRLAVLLAGYILDNPEAVRLVAQRDSVRVMANAVLGRVLLGLEHGDLDRREVDHINGDVLDNRRANLRVATRSQNGANRRGWAKSGHKGVYQSRGRYIAAIRVDGKRRHLGTFCTPGEASLAYAKAAGAAFGEFANCGVRK